MKLTVEMEIGIVYEGEWDLSNLQHGRGTQRWPDGTIYEGEWHYGKMNGLGTINYPEGDTYEGLWIDN